jgi:tRNA/tmRNA/rRNA uracil-C5-methylase (TrmA/RlmC/RlmD family)
MQRYTRRFGSARVDTLLIDPPRSGFPKITDWLAKLKPEYLIYVSCNPRSLAQDIQSIENRGSKYTVKHIELFDMFPGTHHFESLVCLQFKKHGK